MKRQRRSLARIDKRDLDRLGQIAEEDMRDLFERHAHRRWQRVYACQKYCVALCQGAASHYLDRTTGVGDFDVWTFFAESQEGRLPVDRRHGLRDFGNVKFGGDPRRPDYVGRHVDLLVRSIPWPDGTSPVEAVRSYLCAGRTRSAKELTKRAVIMVRPPSLLGAVVWPLHPRNSSL